MIKKDINMADVFSAVEEYGAKKYRKGQADAYAVAVKQANGLLCDVLDMLLVDKPDVGRMVDTVAEYVDIMEQIADVHRTEKGA